MYILKAYKPNINTVSLLVHIINTQTTFSVNYNIPMKQIVKIFIYDDSLYTKKIQKFLYDDFDTILTTMLERMCFI